MDKEILEAEKNWEKLQKQLFPTNENELLKPHGDSLATNIKDDPILNSDCITLLKKYWNGTAYHFHHFHCYPITNHISWNQWRNPPNNGGNIWWCNNLSQAAHHYSWTIYSGGTFEQLSFALQRAIQNGNQLHTAVVCRQILKWGGVGLGDPRQDTDAINWIYCSASRCNLINDINIATRALRANSTHPLDIFGSLLPYIPMTSGTTKIFSAAGMDFSKGYNKPRQDVLILDGRVASGICLMIRKIFQPHGALPNNLVFPRDSSNANRNPNCDHMKFPNISAIGNRQTRAQLRAHYTRLGAKYITDVFGSPSHDFIKAEQALFMIGYDVCNLCANCGGGLRSCP